MKASRRFDPSILPASCPCPCSILLHYPSTPSPSTLLPFSPLCSIVYSPLPSLAFLIFLHSLPPLPSSPLCISGQLSFSSPLTPSSILFHLSSSLLNLNLLLLWPYSALPFHITPHSLSLPQPFSQDPQLSSLECWVFYLSIIDFTLPTQAQRFG